MEKATIVPSSESMSAGPGGFAEVFKIVLVGDSGVGKTNLLSAAERYAKGEPMTEPVESQRATVGVEFTSMTFEAADGKRIKAQIWDTAGQERYRAITRSHYRRAAGALLVYDVTNPESFANAQNIWLPELLNAAQDEKTMKECIMMVGNKTDLTARIGAEGQDAKASQMDLTMNFRTSARTGAGVDEAFGQLIQRVYEQRKHSSRGAATAMARELGSSKAVGSCC